MAQAGDARSFPTAYIVGCLLVGVGLILGLARPLFFASAALGALVIFVGAAVEGSHAASPSHDGSVVVGGVLLVLAVAIPLTVAMLIWGPSTPTRQLLALPALDALDQARIALPDTVEGTYRLDVTFDDTSDDWRARPELLFPIDRPRDIRRLAERLEPAGWDLVGDERSSSGTDYAVFRGPSQPQSAEMPSFFDWRKATRFELGEIASAKVLENFPVSEASKITFEAPKRLVDATEPSADRRQPAAGEGIEKTIVKIDRDTEVIEVHVVGAAIRSTPEFVRDALESNWFPLLIPGGALGVVWRRLRKRDKAQPDSPPGDAAQPPGGGAPAAGTTTIVTQRREYDSTAVEERPNGTRQQRTPTSARAFTTGECRTPPTAGTAQPVSPEATTARPSSPRRAPPTTRASNDSGGYASCGPYASGVASMPSGTIKRRTRMYASLRTYRIGSGSVDAVLRRVDRDFAEALSREPGFVAYHAIDTGHDMVMTISLFHDREQADASNELAAQWVGEELSDFNVTRVGIIGGEAMVSRASAEILEPAHP